MKEAFQLQLVHKSNRIEIAMLVISRRQISPVILTDRAISAQQVRFVRHAEPYCTCHPLGRVLEFEKGVCTTFAIPDTRNIRDAIIL